MTTTAATRRCSCGAILRALNPGPLCSPCDSAAVSRQLRAMRAPRNPENAEHRRAVILSLLEARPASLMQIAGATGVTDTTASADLIELIGEGKVRRGPKVMGLRTYELAG